MPQFSYDLAGSVLDFRLCFGRKLLCHDSEGGGQVQLCLWQYAVELVENAQRQIRLFIWVIVRDRSLRNRVCQRDVLFGKPFLQWRSQLTADDGMPGTDALEYVATQAGSVE